MHDHLQTLATFHSTLTSSQKFIWVLCLQEWNNLMYFWVYYVAMAYLHKAIWKSLQDMPKPHNLTIINAWKLQWLLMQHYFSVVFKIMLHSSYCNMTLKHRYLVLLTLFSEQYTPAKYSISLTLTLYIWISRKALWTYTFHIVDALSAFCSNTTSCSRTWFLLRSTPFIRVSNCSSITHTLIYYTILTMGICTTNG